MSGSTGDPGMSSWAFTPHPGMLRPEQQAESLVVNWRQFQQAALSYNLDPNLLALSAARGDLQMLHQHHQHQHRRRLATRETTGVLRAWLSEHKMNPYPTKGEKIMLAVITAMTLTQVSTWFANARRRLKKENKMTWTPRHRPGEGEEEDEDVEVDVEDDDDKVDAAVAKGDKSAATADCTAETADRKRRHLSGGPDLPDCDAARTAQKRSREDGATSPIAASALAASKPRIWSIVDTATRAEPPKSHQRFHVAAAASVSTAAAAMPPPPPPPLHMLARHQGPSAHQLSYPSSAAFVLSSPSMLSPAAALHAALGGRPSQHQQHQHHHLMHPLMPPPLLPQPYAAACEARGGGASPLSLSPQQQLPPHLLRSA